MKKPLLPGFLFAAALMVPVRAEPSTPHLSAKVRVEAGTDFKKIGGSSASSKTQTRQIVVILDNRETSELKDISVRWKIYARSMKDNQLKVAKEGTEKTSVGPLKTTTVKSDKVILKGSPKHSVTSQKSGRGGHSNGRPNVTTKTVQAEGEEYAGYAVRVYAGGRLVDEEYSQPGLKEPD
jgi:hypothetical protein